MRILLVTPFSPYSLQNGGFQRTNFLWKALCELGMVDVLMITEGPRTAISVPQDRSFVAEVTFRHSMLGLERFFPNRRLGRLIEDHIDLRAYDLICGRYLRSLSMLATPRGIPTLVDLDDYRIDYSGPSAHRGLSLSSFSAFVRPRVRWALEEWAVRRFTRFWFATDRDCARCPHLRGGTLRNIPIGPRRAPVFSSDGATVLFVGQLAYVPNRNGVERFLTRVWPRVLDKVPHARLRLVGAAPVGDQQRLEAHPHVEAPGFVDDLEAVYQDSAFSIAPLYAGGGSSIKVLESLAHGRTCLTTNFSLDTFRPHFDGRNDIVAASSDAEMADQCVDLLQNPKRRETLAIAGNKIVKSAFGYDEFRAVVRNQVGHAFHDVNP
jgi:glycosyltransferase involved in cell wall biosynthesis